MKIIKFTITGADDKVSIDELVRLTEKYPKVEWGILMNGKDPKQRYPSEEWVKELVKKIPSKNLSAHLCGARSLEVLIEDKQYALANHFVHFDRVQINYRFTTPSKIWSAEYKFLEKIGEYMKIIKDNYVIFQVTKDTEASMRTLITNGIIPSNIHLLYDSSGGRGKIIDKIGVPFLGRFTGYAGGINPENIGGILVEIHESHGDQEVWIDLESGVRTNNEFDLKICENLLWEVFDGKEL